MAQEIAELNRPQSKGCGQRLRMILALTIVVYFILGIAITLALAFLAGGKLGTAAFTQPRTFLVCLFWPVAAWQYLLIVLGI